MTDLFKGYFNSIKKLPQAEATEHTLRTPLENLLEGLNKANRLKIDIIQEPKHDKSGLGAPDFILKHDESIVGYLETKSVNTPLDDVLKSDQIKKYQKLSNNILLTNYLEFIWLRDGKVNQRETLCYLSDIGKNKAKLDANKAQAVESLLLDFLSVPPTELADARKLAEALATRCHDLRDFLFDTLRQQEKSKQKGKLYGLYGIFKNNVFQELKLEEFADAFAQTLGYGLFLAKLNAEHKHITLRNAKQHIPHNFKLIGELVDFLDELEKPEYDRIRWLVEEILSILNTLNLVAINETLSLAKRSRNFRNEDEKILFEKDPYVYFYENFLEAYDKETRKSRGVYYTPPPVVNFIVRAIDDILQDTFQLKDGLADRDRVTVLDFATGTGTFLLETVQCILEKTDRGIRKEIIREHILQNLYGFEYLIAPYTVAHLKLSQFLRDQDYQMRPGERLRIYLTNTLEPITPKDNSLLPMLSREIEEAQEIKDKPILVITGNPPYSRISKNKGKWINDLIETYKYVDGKHFGERKHWLNDDYVKFIRFAHHKISQADEGIVAVITNHSFLDNLTFRGMRWSLMQEFDQLYFIDLHGNANKEEKTPEGGNDENVFDIKQGVAISLMVKNPNIEKGIYHFDLWGERREKYNALLELGKGRIEWQKLEPSAPFYFFVPRDESNRKEYGRGYSINDIFIENVTGIVTSRDKLTIHYDKESLWHTVQDFANLPQEEARQKYNLKGDGRDWKVITAQRDLKYNGLSRNRIRPIGYQPFDQRVTYYTGRSRGFHSNPRGKIMHHMLAGDNLGLSITRQVKTGDTWQHCLISSGLIELTYLSNRTSETAQLSPLYLQPDSIEQERKENFTDNFRNFINQRYEHQYLPETILGYIYAILHSPTYRKRYIEFLKIDFPRIPFADGCKTFEALAKLGEELIQVHLLKNIPDTPKVEALCGGGGGHYIGEWQVDKPKYDEKNERLYANKTQYFVPVSKDVWEFHIGGYQVLDKYLKSRKGRCLSLDEIDNIKNTIKALAFTIEQMEKIDKTWSIQTKP